MSTYKSIVEHYENCLEKYGDTHLGVDWPNENEMIKRYQVMLNILSFTKQAESELSVLDFGCGTAGLNSYIKENKFNNLKYFGLDFSSKFIDVAKNKYPNNIFFCLDILKNKKEIGTFDYSILNGVFTEKRELSFDEMWLYFQEVITKVFQITNKGIAFNVMSKNVEWERDDLFHVPLDLLTSFLSKELSRHFIIRNDYGLYEYTVYLFKKSL
jgi:SAM-dependent methyltransferase